MSSIQLWTLIFTIITFGFYLYIAYASRVSNTSDFYVAGGGIPAPANGAAIAADWMSAASFISLAGIVGLAYNGYGGSVFLMGWTGGYVLLALLLAPYLRKFGKYTLPDFVGDRYSETARLVAVVAAIVVSFVYVAGQMAGVGLVFTRFLKVDTTVGVVIGMAIVFFYAVLGGMKGITWTQVAQYSVLIVAYLIPAVAVSQKVTGIPLPQVGFGSILDELNGLQADLGLGANYTEAFGQITMPNMVLITAALMFGTAGLPHVIVRFYTAKSVRAARYSALWALFFIALLYTTAPSVAAFTKLEIMDNLQNFTVASAPEWFGTWADVGLITQAGEAAAPISQLPPDQALTYTDVAINNDIIVLASPEIGGLPAPIVGLVAAGALAAALSTASGLLLVISSAVANDVYFKKINPQASEAAAADGRPVRDGRRHPGGGLPRHQPSRVRGAGGRLGLRARRGELLPDPGARHLLEELHRGGCHGRHHHGSVGHVGLHDLDDRHLGQQRRHLEHPRDRLRHDRHADQLRGHDRRVPVHEEAVAGDAGAGRGDPLPRPQRAGCPARRGRRPALIRPT